MSIVVLVAVGGSQRRGVLLVLGAICAALVFTKINVGAFFGIALLSALVCPGPLSRPHRTWFLGLLVFSSLALLILFRPSLE